MASALSNALVEHQGYTAMDIDCSSYRSDGEAASWDGAKSYWSGSSPGEVTQFIHRHPKAVIVFHRIDETLPTVMAALRTALSNGLMVDGHGLDDERDDSGRRRKIEPTKVVTRDAVFIFTAEHATEWLKHAQVDTVLGDSDAQRRANLLGELMNATREHKGERTHRFDPTVLQAMATHHHLLAPTPWHVLRELAMTSWPQVQQMVHRQLGRTLCTPAAEDIEDLSSLIMLSHGARVALAHAQPEALYREAFQALQTQRMAEAAACPTALQHTGLKLMLGLTPQARTQWAHLSKKLGDDPVNALSRQHAFVRLQFGQHPDQGGLGADDAWWLTDVSLQPVRALADYTGASGLVSRIPDNRLDEVCGHQEVKRHLRSVIAQLKAPEQLKQLGIQPPRGVVLHGPPGSGKTLLARALAGEAQLPFISVTGTELLDPSTLRRVYDVAHRNEPCVIHIDEADALGRRGGQSPAHDAAINLLLTKIDGFAQSVGVFHVLTTNRPDELDAALTRPGRIERRFLVGPLDREARREQLAKLWPVLQVPQDQMDHARQRLVEQTYGMTGAELAQFHAEVVRHALGSRLGVEALEPVPAPQVTLDVALSVLSRLRFGDANPVQADERYRRRVAEHEAGHALAHCLLMPQMPLTQVTIVPRGNSAGAVIGGGDQVPQLDETPVVIRAFLTTLLAGRAAEMMLYGAEGPSSGSTQDLATATAAAYKAVAVSGLDEQLGCMSIAGLGKAVSQKLLEAVEARVRFWVESAAREALRLLRQHRDAHGAIVQALLQRETLYGHEVADMVSRALSKPAGDEFAAGYNTLTSLEKHHD
jgi:cell division protease FtsH